MSVMRVVSGGQAGVDRGALDAARAWRIPIGGWIPAGRLAEDGQVPDDYPLKESESADPAERTRLNVRDSDGTLIISHGPLSGGSQVTLDAAVALGRPCIHLDLDLQPMKTAVEAAASWLTINRISTLNVAGPRHSEDPTAYQASLIVTTALLARKAITETDEAQLVWDEYKYRHDLIWRHLIRSTLALVALITIGYSDAFRATNALVVLASVTAIVYAIITILVVEPELRILQKIKDVHRSRQADLLGVTWDDFTPQAGRRWRRWGAPFLADGFGGRVAVYLAVLLLATTVAGWMTYCDPDRPKATREPMPQAKP